MPQISRNALVMYSAQEMYHLVNDVSAYAEFLPHCSDSKIITQSAGEMTAALEISKAGLKKWFTTQNILIENQAVQMQLLDGPFKTLSGGWTFKELDEYACKVSLELEFEFTNRLVEMAFGKVFNEVATNMITAFTQRAKQVYGVR